MEQPHRTSIYTTMDSTIIIPPSGPIRVGTPPFFAATETHMRNMEIPNDSLVVAAGVAPPPMNIPTLIVSLPGRLTYCDLSSYNAWLHFPLPSEAEVRQLRDEAFPHVNNDQLERRLHLWGPIPRSVLTLSRSNDQRQL